MANPQAWKGLLVAAIIISLIAFILGTPSINDAMS
jgi:hypothetical protein